MKTTYLITGLSIILLTQGCASRVQQFQYIDAEPRSANCDVDIIYTAVGNTNDRKHKILAEIRVGDTGFSTNGSQQDVEQLLRDKACEYGADAVDIYKMNTPNIVSTCFRARGKLIKYSN